MMEAERTYATEIAAAELEKKIAQRKRQKEDRIFTVLLFLLPFVLFGLFGLIRQIAVWVGLPVP
jgi:hypothetical protein